MSREAHAASVAVARAEVEGLMNIIRAAGLKQEEALGAVAVAVGDDPSSDAGRAAFEYVAKLRDDIDELVRIADNAMQLLDNYAAGF